jgi:hypothetical protein
MGTMDEERVRARMERRDAEAVDDGQSIAVRSVCVCLCSEVSWVMVGPRYCTPGTRRRDKEEDRSGYPSLERH